MFDDDFVTISRGGAQFRNPGGNAAVIIESTLPGGGASIELVANSSGGGSAIDFTATGVDLLTRLSRSPEPNGVFVINNAVGAGGILLQSSAGTNALSLSATGVVSGVFGTYHVASDGRLKRNVVNIPNALKRVLAPRGINFKWKDAHLDGDSLQMGLIAQEVEKVFPETVHTAKDKMRTKAVEYEHLIGALVEAIKELDGIVKQKDAELQGQGRRIGTVESRLAALEAHLPKVAQTDRRD